MEKTKKKTIEQSGVRKANGLKHQGFSGGGIYMTFDHPAIGLWVVTFWRGPWPTGPLPDSIKCCHVRCSMEYCGVQVESYVTHTQRDVMFS